MLEREGGAARPRDVGWGGRTESMRLSAAILIVPVLAGCAGRYKFLDSRSPDARQIMIREAGTDGSELYMSVHRRHYRDLRRPGKSGPGGRDRQGVPPRGFFVRFARVVLELRARAGDRSTEGQVVDRGPHFAIIYNKGMAQFRLKPDFHDDVRSKRLYDRMWRMLNELSRSGDT